MINAENSCADSYFEETDKHFLGFFDKFETFDKKVLISINRSY